jgi:glycosyltransferase involved in cell wall biosynthesis
MTISVAVNLLWLVPGDVGGSEESTVASLRGLIDLAPDDLDLRLLVLEPFAEAHPDIVAALPTETLSLSGRSRSARVLGETTWLAHRTKGVDLVHHAGGTAPPRSRAPYVLTLHDLQPLERQATHSAAKRAYLGAVVPRSVRRARRVIVPSAFVRDTVVAHTGIAPAKLTVVPHGVDRHRAPSAESDLRSRFDLDGHVVLYPAITYPHKNHATLVDAFARVLSSHPDALLVLTGRADSAEPALLAQVARSGIGERVRRLGRVSTADLAGLYELARVVAVPSRYEGFGLPAIEAMAHEAALVVATGSALTEVAGDAAWARDPDDVAGWADAIAGLLDDFGATVRLRELGSERATHFTVAANARGLADTYRAALSGS